MLDLRALKGGEQLAIVGPHGARCLPMAAEGKHLALLRRAVSIPQAGVE
jgi:hypothetical protein